MKIPNESEAELKCGQSMLTYHSFSELFQPFHMIINTIQTITIQEYLPLNDIFATLGDSPFQCISFAFHWVECLDHKISFSPHLSPFSHSGQFAVGSLKEK